jgi:hypothetical protein
MAESWRWDNLYGARANKTWWRDQCNLADLYVSAWPQNIHKQSRYRLLCDGTRVVPYSVMATSSATHRDPRVDPMWAECFTLYEAPCKQDLLERGLATKGADGVIYSNDGMWILPDSQIQTLTVGEYYRGSGDNSYWTDDEVQEEIDRNKQYAGIYQQAVSWWLLLHGLNPDAITPYHGEVTRTLQLINMQEAGDPTMALILETTEPAAPEVQPVSASPLSTPTTSASMMPTGFIDRYKKYWPYAAAGGVVLLMLSRPKT